MAVLIGTSGWMYRHWRETFYPKGVAQKRWLEFYAERFATVESNNAFYMLPGGPTFRAWAERTPGDFVMAVKMSRYLTHIKRLAEPDEPIRRFVSRASELGSKLGPVLLQLPPSLQLDIPRLRRVLELVPPEIRVAVEFRHESWYTDEVRSVLTDAGAALCLADRQRPLTPLWRTAGWGYLRFHDGLGEPRPCYTSGEMRDWASRVADLWAPAQDVFAYFNNDPRACALRDAIVFRDEMGRSGWVTTRVPGLDEVTVA
jgi:uncharacterized protein YecE (DUF72 family)